MPVSLDPIIYELEAYVSNGITDADIEILDSGSVAISLASGNIPVSIPATEAETPSDSVKLTIHNISLYDISDIYIIPIYNNEDPDTIKAHDYVEFTTDTSSSWISGAYVPIQTGSVLASSGTVDFYVRSNPPVGVVSGVKSMYFDIEYEIAET